MTQPGNPDPNAHPQYGQPAPPPSGQPSGYPSAPPPAYGGAPTNRPGLVTAAAVIAFVWGGLGLLFNLLAFGLLGGLGVPGIFVVLIIVSLVLSAALIFGGVQALQGKSFVILLVVAGISILINVISMIVYFTSQAIIGFIIPVVIIVLLMNPQSKAWITARGGKTLG